MVLGIGKVTATAARIDTWLHRKGGRPYAILLNVGLVADIVHRVMEAPHDITEAKGWIGTGLAVTLDCALLIHQLAEMSERMGRKRKTHSGEASPPD